MTVQMTDNAPSSSEAKGASTKDVEGPVDLADSREVQANGAEATRADVAQRALERGGTSGSKARGWLSIVFRVVSPILAMGLLVWLLYRIGWDEIAEVAGQVGPIGMVFLVVLGLTESLGDSLSLHYASGGTIPKLATFTANTTGAVLNWFVPLEAGEAYKIAALSRHGGSRGAAIAVLLWNYAIRWSGPGMAFVAAVVGSLTSSSMSRTTQLGIIAAAALALGPYLAIRLTLASGVLLRGFSWVVHRFLKKERAERFHQTISDVHERVRTFRKTQPRGYRGLWVTQLIAKAAAWSSVYVACQLMGLRYSFGQCALVYAALSVMTYVTTIFPARVGVSESAAFVLFEAIGLPGQYGLLLAFIIRLRALLANGIGSFAGFALGSLRSSARRGS